VDTGGRVGGLLSPPVLVDDDVVVFGAEDVDAVRGRFGAMPGRFGGTFSLLTPFASFGGVSFSVSVSTSDVIAVVSSPERTSAGASS
jgi:hypothetical protein